LLLISLCIFANLIIALPMDRRWHQGAPVWLTITVSAAIVLGVAWLWGVVLTPYKPEKGRTVWRPDQ
jgi:hypothetical protein